MRPLSLIPVLLFAALFALLGYRLFLVGQGETPDMIPSVLIGKPMPDFRLPPQEPGRPEVTSDAIRGKITLINFFASWCAPCRVEHPSLVALARDKRIQLIGIAYKDRPNDLRDWLQRQGNPYDAIGLDDDGRVAIEFGVYGIPESYLIDRDGRIRFKQTGPFSESNIAEKLIPLIEKLSR